MSNPAPVAAGGWYKDIHTGQARTDLMDALQAAAMVGGYSRANEAVHNAVQRADQCLLRMPLTRSKDDPIVGVGFHIAGPLIQPHFTGFRRDGFLVRDRIVGIKLAVPDPFPPGTEAAFVCAALARAVDMAEQIARARSLDWSFEQARAGLDRLRDCLNVASPVPDVSDWLSPANANATREPAEAETMLSVQLPTRTMAPTRADVVFRQHLEQLLQDALAQAENGSVDGGDIGSGMLGVYVRVAQPTAIQTVLNVLRTAGQLDAAIVVIRRQDPGAAEAEEYAVVWPLGYAGPAEPADLFSGFANRGANP